MTSSPDELRARFGAVYTAALTDVMDDLGRRHQTLPPEVVPLEPGARVAGPAFAVEGRTNHSIDPEASIRRILEMLGAVPAGPRRRLRGRATRLRALRRALRGLAASPTASRAS